MSAYPKLDEIYKHIDTLMREDKIDIIDEILISVCKEETSLSELIAYLTITLPIKNRSLFSRAALYRYTEYRAIQMGEKDIEGLMCGLK
jgi:hypothetical protein